MYEPHMHETDAASRLYAPLEALTRAVNSAAPDRLQTDLGAIFDLSEFVKFIAIQRATSEIDGFIGNWSMSNFYLYRFRDGRPTQLLPWDEDHAFWQADMAIDDRLDTNVLTAKVMQDAALRRLYLDTLVSASQTIAQTVPGDDRGWLEREADRLETKIAAAAAADPVSPFTFDEFTSNISGLRGLLRVRPPFVVCQAGAAIDPEAPQSCPAPDPIEISAPLPR